MFNRRVFRTLAFVAGVSVFSTVTWAASGEVSGYAGGSTSDGGDLTSAGLQGGTSGFFGGTAGVGLGDKSHLFGDFGFGTVASGVSSGVTLSQRIVDFGLGFDFGFGSSDKVVPYVVGEVGVGHGSLKGSLSGTSATLGDGNQVYAGGGGGVRFFLGHSWGIKPEVQYRRYGSDGINTVIFSAGVFFDFGK